MRLRVVSAAVVLGALLFLTGCQANREMQAEVVNLKASTKKQLDLLKRQNEFLNRKLNTMTAKVDELTKKTDDLSAELTTYINRPDEVKIEIIEEVNTRFRAIAQQNDEFKADLMGQFQAKADAVDERLDTEMSEMDRLLNKHTTFVQFVAAEQDSINRVFANRFDSRPWYQSIIGKWEDRERAEGNTP